MSLFLFLLFDGCLFCIYFTVVKRKLKLAADAEADFFLFRNRSLTLHCCVGRSLIILNSLLEKDKFSSWEQLPRLDTERHWKNVLKKWTDSFHWTSIWLPPERFNRIPTCSPYPQTGVCTGWRKDCFCMFLRPFKSIRPGLAQGSPGQTSSFRRSWTSSCLAWMLPVKPPPIRPH